MAERSAAPGGAGGSRGALPWRVGDSVRTERSVCGCDPVWEGPETQGKGAGSGDRRLRLDTRGEALDARCQGLLGRSWAESSPSWARLRRGSPPLTEAARPRAPLSSELPQRGGDRQPRCADRGEEPRHQSGEQGEGDSPSEQARCDTEG